MNLNFQELATSRELPAILTSDSFLTEVLRLMPLRITHGKHEATYFGFSRKRFVITSTAFGVLVLPPETCFAAQGPIEISGADGFAVVRVGYVGLNSVVAAERVGRLKYIDGCTDTLLIAPPKLGDPCLNLLHFPPGITQTKHTHPSNRVGMIASGRGRCVTPHGNVDLLPGVVFVIPKDAEHSFETVEEEMRVIAWHPDTDSGPSDESHPMLDRTIVGGVSAGQKRRSDGMLDRISRPSGYVEL